MLHLIKNDLEIEKNPKEFIHIYKLNPVKKKKAS